MIFKRIEHVEIVTDQLDRTVQFYTDGLTDAQAVLGARVERQPLARVGLEPETGFAPMSDWNPWCSFA